ncbi:MAG: hypothetical protein QM747_01510 [Nocardioides sp.]
MPSRDRRLARLLASHALAATAMSLPWPWLLVLVWHQSHDPRLLGLAAAARMAPYVACSWWAGRIGDRCRRDVVVRTTVVLRLVLLTAVAAAAAWDRPGLAVVLAAVAVAVATPAYPTLAAAIPAAAAGRAERATETLVTIEVASFVVGPALGGLLLGAPALVAGLSVGATAVSLALLTGLRLPTPTHERAAAGGVGRALRSSRQIRRALSLMAWLNLVNAALGITLLLLARGDWTGRWSPDTAYGLASGALGFGALLTPALFRCGTGPVARSRWGLLLMAGGISAAALSPRLGWAVVPLLLVGAAAVHAESAATGVIQVEAEDDVRASLFGLADGCMVGAALVGALLAPSLAHVIGPKALLAVLAVTAGATAWSARGLQSLAQVRDSTAVPPMSSSVSTDDVSPAARSSETVRSA